MTCDLLVHPSRKYCSIRHKEYPEFQTGIFARMERAHIVCEVISYANFQIVIMYKGESDIWSIFGF